MTIQRKRVAKRLASGLLAGALALGGLAISGGSVSAKTPVSLSTDRIAGEDRYETSVAIARDYYTTPSSEFGAKGLVIASGEAPYDALAASSLAGMIDAPIVLVKKDSLPSSAADLLDDYKANFRAASSASRVWVIGGTSAVSDDVIDAVKAIIHTGDATPMTVSRIAGDDRYATAKAVADIAGLTDALDRMIIVSGENGKWADALSAGTVAAVNKWPIILTDSTGLQASAKAAIDAFLLLPGSSKQFLIVGGKGVIPGSVEEYLDTKGVNMSKIDRRGGLDRYHTNFLMNVYILDGGPVMNAVAGAEDKGGSNNFSGTYVALTSGQSPYDALAAGPWAAKKGGASNAGRHILLTPGASVTPWSLALGGLLGNELFNKPTKVQVIGGKNAVPNAIRDGFIAAAQSSDAGASTLDCVVNQKSIYLSLDKALADAAFGGTEVAAFTKANLAPYLKLNGVKESTVSWITSVTADGDYTLDDGTTHDRKNWVITTTKNLNAGDVITFDGVVEGTISGINRSIGGGSCTVAADATAPTATVKFVVTAASAGTFDHALVTLSEAHSGTGATVADPATISTTSLTSNLYWKYANGDPIFAADGTSLAATRISSKIWKVSMTAVDAATAPTIAAGTATYLLKEAVMDLSGNGLAANVAGTAATDSTKPSVSVAATTCTGLTAATMVNGGLTMTAAAKGPDANAWTHSVVNVRGTAIPSIAVDTAAKTITITADTSYHLPADIASIALANNITSPWKFTASSSTAMAKTLVPLGPVTSGGTQGDSQCLSVLSINEPALIGGTAAVTVSNVAATSVSSILAGLTSTLDLVEFVTTASGPILITGMTFTDVKNASANVGPLTAITGATP